MGGLSFGSAVSWLAILYKSEEWYLQERSMVRPICGLQLKDRKRAKDLMLALGFNETIDRLAMANSVGWYGCVLRRGDGHVLIGVLEFEVQGHKKKRRPKSTCKKQVEEESMKSAFSREDALCRLMQNVGVNGIATRCRLIRAP